MQIILEGDRTQIRISCLGVYRFNQGYSDSAHFWTGIIPPPVWTHPLPFTWSGLLPAPRTDHTQSALGPLRWLFPLPQMLFLPDFCIAGSFLSLRTQLYSCLFREDFLDQSIQKSHLSPSQCPILILRKPNTICCILLLFIHLFTFGNPSTSRASK